MRSFRERHRFALQTMAFGLILLPPVGLYFTVTSGVMWATWALMGLIAVGMLLALWSS